MGEMDHTIYDHIDNSWNVVADTNCNDEVKWLLKNISRKVAKYIFASPVHRSVLATMLC